MKPTILVPIAGNGSRFPRETWIVPKPLILIDNRTIIEWTMDCIDYSGCELVFIVRRDHVDEFSIDDFLRKKFGESTKVVIVEELTGGAVETCMSAKQHIDLDSPVAIHCSDVLFEPKFKMSEFNSEADGCILTFKSNSSNYSYSQVDEKGFVTNVVEKKVISNSASAGLYWFKSGKIFLEAAEDMFFQETIERSSKEKFLAPLYNFLQLRDRKATTQEVSKMHIFGTAEEYNFFVKNSLRTFKKGCVALCSDHSGVKAKNLFKEILEDKNIPYIDFGCFNERDTDYSQYVAVAAKAVLESKCAFGVAFCRSGQGVNIAANKIKGIRSAWVNNAWMSEMAVRHNCANFLAISEKMNDKQSMLEILKSYLENTFDGGRHQNRLMRSEN